jgi:hypothetical protein
MEKKGANSTCLSKESKGNYGLPLSRMTTQRKDHFGFSCDYKVELERIFLEVHDTFLNLDEPCENLNTTSVHELQPSAIPRDLSSDIS